MSLVSSSTSAPNFGVRVPTNAFIPNRTAPSVCEKDIKQNVGASSANIPVSFLTGGSITVAPTAANQVYTLPTASAILSEFGKSIDTGVPKLGANDTLRFRIVNRGAFPAYIASNATGGDGTAIIAFTGGASSASVTGTAAVLGKSTVLYLEWLAVSGSTNGATGSYTIYQ